MTAENKSLVSAEIAGRKVRRKNFIRRAILGVLFFFGVIFCSITAAGLLASSFLVENILSLFGFVLAAVLLVLEDTIVRFDLQEHCNKVPAALSKGTQQKLSIAMALLRSFDILVADEPFTGLDPTQIAVLKDCLLEVKQAGKLVLLSSHLLSVVENICDRYVIIKKGKLLAAGTRKALMHQSDLPDSTSMETLYLKLVNNHEKNSK